MERPVIRCATPDDLPGVFTIYDREVLNGTATFETVCKTPQERLEWLRTHPPERHPALVAVADGEVVGWAAVSRWSPRRAYDRTGETSVYVRADRHRQGIGRSLMLDLERRARAAGIAVLVARIVEGNPASLRLHEGLGFGTVGVMRRVGEKFGRLLDVRIMDKHLDL